MSTWHCRLTAPMTVAREACTGPRHSECGLRYAPGEFTVTREGLVLPGIGTVRMKGTAFTPKNAAVIVFQDANGWIAEFDTPGMPR